MEGPVGGEEQPQRSQGEENHIDGGSQPGHLTPHFDGHTATFGYLRLFAVIVHNDTDNPDPSRGVA